MANAPVGFPVPQMQEGLDKREALDCFILDYIDCCTVMGWFERKDGCQYDDQSEDGKKQWKKQNLCMSTLRATLPSKMKRLINPNNKTLGLSEGEKSDPVKVIQALVKRFGGSVSVQAERTKMGRMFQSEGESISAWECRVVERAKYCEYGNFEEQACCDRFITGLVDETLQEKLNTNGHRDKDGNIVEFRTVVEIAKNYESSPDARRLMRQVLGDQEQVNWTEKAPQSKRNSSRFQSQSNGKQSECNYCGATPDHPKEKCRAFLLKYKCRKCGKEGHVARKCLSKPQNVNALDDSVSDDGKQTYHLFTLDTHSVRSVSVQKGKKFFAAHKLSAAKNSFAWKTLQLDTASTTNTLAVDDLRTMCPAGFDIHGLIKPSSAILRTYGGGVIKPGLIEIGQSTCSLDCNNPKGGASEVCQLDLGSQRGRVEESGPSDGHVRPASLNGSATEELNLTEETTSTSPVHGTCEYISAVHSAVTTKEKVSPKGSMASEVGVSHVPVPWGKLTKAIVMDNFKDVHTGLGTLGPPLHISMNPSVTPIQAHPHRYPVAKEAKASDTIRDLEKQDVYKGFTNIELDDSSSFLTTMHTPIGRYRWLRMPFGVSLIPEEYQRRQHEALEGLVGVVNKADDILVFGSGDSIEEAEKDHDKIVKPLTELTHGSAVWSWSSQHDKAFKTAKSLIANAATLKFFDVNKPCVLQVDASDTGLGGALLQDGQPVAFTSSTLSATEVNYAPIEKECLAIKVACTKFYQYLYGKKNVAVHSDHQPLETIFKKPLSKAPRRLQRMMLQLQPFKFTVVYKKGKYMYLADTLSRAALNLPTPSDPQEEVFQCNSENALETFRVELETMELDSPNMYPSTLEAIKAETEADHTLSVLCAFVAHGWPSDKSQVPTALRPLYPLRDELVSLSTNKV
ncbi:uncharacterized protein [Montipora capricornis]|uniref:uncharacterized protein n=1 Tax=Montipora capricornis TaxID=246305 RepID=UPI0035F122D6